jgi:hypothetical protein
MRRAGRSDTPLRPSVFRWSEYKSFVGGDLASDQFGGIGIADWVPRIVLWKICLGVWSA